MRILRNVGVLGLAVSAVLAWGRASKGPSPVPTDERGGYVDRQRWS